MAKRDVIGIKYAGRSFAVEREADPDQPTLHHVHSYEVLGAMRLELLHRIVNDYPTAMKVLEEAAKELIGQLLQLEEIGSPNQRRPL